MKSFYFLLFSLFLLKSSNAQVELSASMGINFINSPSLYDYLTQNYPTIGETIEGFNSAINFTVEGGYNISQTYQPALEIGYLIYSYTTTLQDSRQYEMAYGNLMISIMNYYVINGEGYNFKLGGGGGVRFVNTDESISGIQKPYSSTGFGVLLRVEGNTLLGENVYAKIGAQAGYDLNGEPENNGIPIRNNASNENVDFNSLSIGLSLGVSYIF